MGSKVIIDTANLKPYHLYSVAQWTGDMDFYDGWSFEELVFFGPDGRFYDADNLDECYPAGDGFVEQAGGENKWALEQLKDLV